MDASPGRSKTFLMNKPFPPPIKRCLNRKILRRLKELVARRSIRLPHPLGFHARV